MSNFDDQHSVFMKRIYLVVALSLFMISAMAQQEYFIFIQEPGGQPFYVRMGEESHSSSAIGHIILSHLKDSVYTLFVGFPKNRIAEQQFVVRMNRKDHGFDLKNNGGVWQLQDLQTGESMNAMLSSHVDSQAIRRTDTYSQLMANVVDDSAVLYMSKSDTQLVDTDTSVVKVDTAAADTLAKVATQQKKSDSVVVKGKKKKAAKSAGKKRVDTTTAVKTDPVKADSLGVPGDSVVTRDTSLQQTSGRDPRDIIRLRTENVEAGKLIIYVDRSGPVNDTIRIIIPYRL
jgi:hypothetical protein